MRAICTSLAHLNKTKTPSSRQANCDHLVLQRGIHPWSQSLVVSVRLRQIEKDDLPLVERWLHSEHVRETWGEPDAILRVLAEPPAKGNSRAIIEANGRQVGLVLWQHPTRAELDLAGLDDIPTSVIDIDILIGDPDDTGHGLGPSAIRQVAEAAFSDPDVPFLIACARVDNLASQRAFAKAGFRKDREFDDVPNGRHVLMVHHRRQAPST